MKKLKILPSILILVLCVGVLAVGVFAITPTQNTISGSITVNATNKPVKIELLKDGVLLETHDEVRSGINWNIGELTFNNLDNANFASDVDDIILTLRVTNLSETDAYGVFFVNPEKPLTKNVDGSYNLAEAENILPSAELFDKTITSDKLADVYFTPYTYLGKKSDSNNFDVVEMNIHICLFDLYDSEKSSNKFTYEMAIEKYEASEYTIVSGRVTDGLSVSTVGTPSYENPLLKLSDTLETLPAYSFCGNQYIEYVVIPSSISSLAVGDWDGDMGASNLSFASCSNLKGVSVCCDATYQTPSQDHFLVMGMFCGASIKYLYINSTINCMADGVTADIVQFYSNLDNLSSFSDLTLGDGTMGTWICRTINKVNYNVSAEGYEIKNGHLTINQLPDTAILDSNIVRPLILSINFSEEVSETITEIPNEAFRGCYSLKEIIVPSNVTSIGNNAFQYCYSLKIISIPNKVNKLGSNAFEYCEGLTSITIPSNVTSIGNNAFQYCERLTSVILKQGVNLEVAHSSESGKLTLPTGLHTEDTIYSFQLYTYTITFNPNGGKIDGSSEIQTKTATTRTEIGALPVPTRDGYTFIGWLWYNGLVDENFASTNINNKTFSAVWRTNS